MSEKRYVFTDGRLVEVSEEVYRAYYSMRRRERAQLELEAKHRVVRYDAWDDGGTAGRDAIPDRASSLPEEAVIASMLRGQLRRCIELLPEKERGIVRALYYDGKTVAELARELGVPRTTLGDLRAHILRKLRGMLERG